MKTWVLSTYILYKRAPEALATGALLFALDPDVQLVAERQRITSALASGKCRSPGYIRS